MENCSGQTSSKECDYSDLRTLAIHGAKNIPPGTFYLITLKICKDDLLAKLLARMSRGRRFLLFLNHRCLVTLKPTLVAAFEKQFFELGHTFCP